MKLNRLVPTMGALAFAASPAFAFDLAPTDGGALQIDGYVDTITSYTRYDKNAPRDGSRFDNLALWNQQFMQGIPFQLGVPGGLAFPGGAVFSSANAGLNFPLVAPFGPGDGVGWSYLGGAGTGTGLSGLTSTVPASGIPNNTAGAFIVPGFFSREAFDLSGGSPSLTIYNWDIQGKEQDQFDFEAAAELKVGWDVTEDVHAQVDLFFSDNNSNASNGGSNVNIDQAFVSWEFADGWTWTTGKQDGFIGWEAWDAPDLYRVNQSNIFAMGGSSIVGTNLAYAPNDEWTITLFLTDGIYGDPLGVKDGEDLAGGLEVSWDKKDANGNSLFSADLDLSYDHNATIGEDAFEETFDLIALTGPLLGGLPVAPTFQQMLFFADSYRESVWGADFNIQVDAVENWTFAFEANYINYDIANATGLLAMANFQIPNAPFPQSITFMASYYDPNDEDLINNQSFTFAGGAVTAITNNWFLMGQDDDELELALAYLTNPVGSDNFGVNFELRYRARQDVDVAPFVNFIGSEVSDRDEIAAFLEVIAVIP